jgi:hypothetical protein
MIERIMMNFSYLTISCCLGLGYDQRFDTEEEAKAFFKTTLATFGDLSEQDWDFITKISIREDPTHQKKYRLHYDPAIGTPFHVFFNKHLLLLY